MEHKHTELRQAVEVSGIMIRKIEHDFQILVEVGDDWRLIYHASTEEIAEGGVISEIVEPNGIRNSPLDVFGGADMSFADVSLTGDPFTLGHGSLFVDHGDGERYIGNCSGVEVKRMVPKTSWAKRLRWLQWITGVHYVHHIHNGYGYKLPWIRFGYFPGKGWRRFPEIRSALFEGEQMDGYHDCTKTGTY